MKIIAMLKLAFLGCVLVATPLYAEMETADKIVVVKGIGSSPDTAKENAIRAAVEQAVGTYVSSESMVKNNQLLSDQILSYSHGYVKEIKILSQEKTTADLFSIHIEAIVITQKIHQKLSALNESITKAGGESLFAEAVSKMNEQKSGVDLLNYNLSKYPQRAYVLTVGKITIADTDYTNKRASIAIPVTFRWDNAFINELKTTVSKVLADEHKMADASWLSQNAFTLGSHIMCFTSKNTLQQSLVESCYVFDNKLMRRLRLAPYSHYMSGYRLPLLLGGYESLRSIPLLITFKNNNGETIGSVKYELNEWDSLAKQGVHFTKQDAKVPGFGYGIDGDFKYSKHLPDTLSIASGSPRGCTILISDGSFTVAAEVDVDVNIVKNIATVDVQVQ